MNTLTIINAISNLLIAISTIAFIVFVFGRFSMLDKLPKYEIFMLKVGLCILASGAFFSFLTFPNPPFFEVVLNVGLASVMTWASVFHYKFFVRKK